MNNSFEFIRFLCTGALGVFAGAMLTEGLVLVPYWRLLPPAEFLTWYAANGQRLLGYFGPLTWLAGLLAIAAALVSLWQSHPGRWPALLAAVLMFAVVSTFYLYFRNANASFATASLPVEKVAGELKRWAGWHWWRTCLSFLALAAGLMSLGRIK